METDSPNIYQIEFIPYYPDIAEQFSLSKTETLLYGFIRFFLKNGANKSFYFSNQHLAKILNSSESGITNAVGILIKNKLIETTIRLKANGGKIRFIRLLNFKSPSLKNSESESEKESVNNKREISKTENKENPSALRDGEENSEQNIQTEQEEKTSGGVLGAGINFDPAKKSSSGASKKPASGITTNERAVLLAFQQISPTTTTRTKSFLDGIRPLVKKIDKIYSGKGEEKLAEAIGIYLSNPKSVEILQQSPFLKTPKIFFKNFGEILLSLITKVKNAPNQTPQPLSEDDKRRIEEANKKELAKLAMPSREK